MWDLQVRVDNLAAPVLGHAKVGDDKGLRRRNAQQLLLDRDVHVFAVIGLLQLLQLLGSEKRPRGTVRRHGVRLKASARDISSRPVDGPTSYLRCSSSMRCSRNWAATSSSSSSSSRRASTSSSGSSASLCNDACEFGREALADDGKQPRPSVVRPYGARAAAMVAGDSLLSAAAPTAALSP